MPFSLGVKCQALHNDTYVYCDALLECPSIFVESRA